MTDIERPEQKDLFEDEIIPLRLAITAMRDSGYKNTAYALAELIDNAVQAGATVVEVLCVERRERVRHRERARLHEMAVLDNGSGMDVATLRMALQFGNGTRLDDRSWVTGSGEKSTKGCAGTAATCRYVKHGAMSVSAESPRASGPPW